MVITTDDLQVYAEESALIKVRTTGPTCALKILATRLLIQGLNIHHDVPDKYLDDDSLACISIEAGSATVPESLSILPPRLPSVQITPRKVYRAHNHRVCCLPACLLACPYAFLEKGGEPGREGTRNES